MVKVVNPCVCTTYKGKAQAYAKIEYIDGKLSISGVIGPMRNGDSKGSSGQCSEGIRVGNPGTDWDEEMLLKFCDIWDEWHLNDMRHYCSHQKALGWVEQAREEVKIETWTLTKEAQQIKSKAESRALECLRKGEPFYPTKDEIAYARMKHSLKAYNGEDISYYYGKLYRDAYELKEKDCVGHPYTEYKMRNCIFYDENELGFLGRPCPECGYRYGSSWLKEEVPQEVIDWLFSLPDTKEQPAWV